MTIRFEIALEDGRRVVGSREWRGGVCRIAQTLPEGKLRAVKAWLPLAMKDSEKVFMNGYQTWTYCPERGKRDRIKPYAPLPKAVVRHFGIDRYGDYHFVDYPNRAGITHGESYCYFRDGEHFRLFASLDERPGYTLFRYDSAAAILTIERDCAGMRCGGEVHAFDLFYAEGAEDEVFDGWFRELGVRPRTREKLAGYSSWYNRYQNIDEKSIREDLNGCARVLRPGDLFQIDDGWEPAVGDWLAEDRKKFPGGLKALVDEIHGHGFKAGLWLAPFVCQKDSALRREHPDWLLKEGGEDWYCGSNWGGFYALDIDNRDFIAYLEETFRKVFDEWGFDLVKLDFLYGAAPFGGENESRAARMTRAMEFLRAVCGDKRILGCGVPLMPAFGLVDYCRISCDVGLDWDNSLVMRMINRERVSTKQAIGNSIFRRQLNGRAWLNDPDVFFLREDNLKLSEKQKHTLATVNSLFGGLLLCSDNMAEYTSRSREEYERLLCNREAKNLRVDADGGLAVSWDADGVSERLEIEL